HPTPSLQAQASSFDTHHPPERELLEDCVHCGFCLPACPTWRLWGEEMDSPRGRIYMMQKASQAEAPLDTAFGTHMDRCLGCMACMTACPSGVQYGRLIEDARGQVERNVPRTAGDRIFRRMLFAIFPHPWRLRLLAVPMLVYQRSGLQRLMRASGLLRLLPKRFEAMEGLLPRVPSKLFQQLPEVVAATNRRRRVGMLSGCVQQVFFQRVNQATARVLAAEGCEIVIPRGQPCCGALMVHSGVDATQMAQRMIEAFEEADVDTIVINAAGCGSTMKEYGHLLRDDPVWSERAAAFSRKCRDVAEVLAEMPAQASRHPLPLRVAYHDACHLRHAQSIWEQPRELLKAVPALEVLEIEEGHVCCGSAGVYNLLQPEAAAELGNRKTGHLLATGAQAVVSANPGCLLQLERGIRERGAASIPTFHLVEVLDASIRQVSVEELMRERQRSA
ncbi:MAG: (Fe-S)-binding protein, partial [Acidobacteriota bacterium]